MTFVNNRSIGVRMKVLITLIGTSLISACSLSFEQMLPSLAGESPVEDVSSVKEPTRVSKAPAAPVQVAKTVRLSQPPTMGNSKFEPTSVTEGKNTGTFVGKRLMNLEMNSVT